MAKLNEMVREFRNSVNQSVEGLALLLGMPPEDYARLEEDWIPPDDVLERLCSLFEWNFQDTKRSALQSTGEPAESQAPSPPPKLLQSGLPPKFSEMLREARETVGQSPEGVATLLGIDSQFYLSIEQGLTPSDDLLQQICSLFHWNYRHVRQRLINRNAAMLFQRPTDSTPPETTETALAPAPGPALGTRIQEQREAVGQTLDGLSILLEISPEFLADLESGVTNPDAALLRRIATLFQWNFHELKLA
jgi:transcriptional regulator with XRE-family HTH domain